MVPAADPHSVSAEFCKEYIYVIAAVPTVEVFENGGFLFFPKLTVITETRELHGSTRIFRT